MVNVLRFRKVVRAVLAFVVLACILAPASFAATKSTAGGAKAGTGILAPTRFNSVETSGTGINNGLETLGFTVGDGLEAAGLAIGAGIAIAGAGMGTGRAQASVGAAGVGSIAEKPESLGTVLMLFVIPETIVILGFVVAYLLYSRIG